MANYFEFKPILGEIARYLRILTTKDCCNTPPVTSAGTGNVPAGFKSVAIVKTSTSADSTIITLSDGSTYTMTEQGEVFSDAALDGQTLPAYTITGAGTIKWHGIK